MNPDQRSRCCRGRESRIIGMSKAKLIWLAIRGHPHVGFRCFISTTARISSGFGPLGPGLVRCFGENSSWYFRCTRARWKCSRVDRFNAIAARRRRVGFIQSEQNPAISRSQTQRFGARRRERFRIGSRASADRPLSKEVNRVFGHYEIFRNHRWPQLDLRPSSYPLFSPTEFETHAEVSFVHAVASIIANRQRFQEGAVIDVLACVRNRVVRRIRDVERFDTEL
jgi:hypothetical protein